MDYRKQEGITLIEVLITIAIVSFGFFSLVNLQIVTIKNLSTTNQNFLVSNITHSVIESLRANHLNLQKYNGKSTRNFSQDCENSVCTMEDYDVWLWKQLIESESHSFPDADGSISVQGNLAKVTIEWLPSSTKNQPATPSTYELEVAIQ